MPSYHTEVCNCSYKQPHAIGMVGCDHHVETNVTSTPPLTADECKLLAKWLENSPGKIAKLDRPTALWIAQMLRWVAEQAD